MDETEIKQRLSKMCIALSKESINKYFTPTIGTVDKYQISSGFYDNDNTIEAYMNIYDETENGIHIAAIYNKASDKIETAIMKTSKE